MNLIKGEIVEVKGFDLARNGIILAIVFPALVLVITVEVDSTE